MSSQNTPDEGTGARDALAQQLATINRAQEALEEIRTGIRHALQREELRLATVAALRRWPSLAQVQLHWNDQQVLLLGALLDADGIPVIDLDPCAFPMFSQETPEQVADAEVIDLFPIVDTDTPSTTCSSTTPNRHGRSPPSTHPNSPPAHNQTPSNT